jgi:hypothetical protein
MKKPEIDFLVEYDDQSILAELRRLAKTTGSNTVTKAHLRRIGRVSHSAVVRRFGGLRQALGLAGLKSGRFMKATDEELLGIIINLWQRVLDKEGRTPQKDELKAMISRCQTTRSPADSGVGGRRSCVLVIPSQRIRCRTTRPSRRWTLRANGSRCHSENASSS